MSEPKLDRRGRQRSKAQEEAAARNLAKGNPAAYTKPREPAADPPAEPAKPPTIRARTAKPKPKPRKPAPRATPPRAPAAPAPPASPPRRGFLGDLLDGLRS